MKKVIITSILAVLVTAGTIVRGQDWPREYLGLPGDNLNLYAVMKLFQESATLEAFERGLNDRHSRINNLDLNRDRIVDYITVTDYVNRNIHTIVLRAVLGRNDYQDVAVIIVERKNKRKVRIQLIGDEALYGRNYIIVPRSEVPHPGYRGHAWYGRNVTVIRGIYYYDLTGWPLVTYIYSPYYRPWHSGFYWGYWPAWYEPWNPWYWHFYYGYHYNWYPHYYASFNVWNHPRHPHYNNYYYPRIRYHSTEVSHRITEGKYQETYSRPDQRTRGEALYTDIHVSGGRSAQEKKAEMTEARRASPVQSARTTSAPATGPATERRTAPAAVSREAGNPPEVRDQVEVRRTPAGTESRREAPAISESRKETPAAVESRREIPATVQRTEPASVQRSAPARSETSPAAPSARQSDERRNSAARPTETRSAEVRTAETRSAATRSSETRSTEVRNTAPRNAETRSSAPVQKSSNDEAPQARTARR